MIPFRTGKWDDQRTRGRSSLLQLQRIKTVSLMECMTAQSTDVSRGSITGNSDRSISTPRTSYHESTMSQFRYAGIHEQGCDFSRDLVERATFECFVAIRHLRDGLKVSIFLIINGVNCAILTL